MHWTTLAMAYENQAIELAQSVAQTTATWGGAAADQAVAAFMPMITWLESMGLLCATRALLASAQATTFSTALATTPPTPEIAQNHITHGTLEATNIFGVNTAPIGVNEADYARMWTQAASVMELYGAETLLNTAFDPMPPPPMVTVPTGEAGALSGIARAAANAPSAVLRDAIFAEASVEGTFQSVALETGNAASTGNEFAQRGEDAAQQGQQQGQNGQQQGDQMGQQMMQQMMQAPQMASQMGQQVMQAPQQMMQQATQMPQQMMQQFTQMMSQNPASQLGMAGATPFSNHPLAGGSGAALGGGLVRAASLPGMGGSSMRTPLVAQLVAGNPVQSASVEPEELVGAAGGPGGGGSAPLGSGGGMGGAHVGEKGKSGGTRQGLTAPGTLLHDLSEEEDDDW